MCKTHSLLAFSAEFRLEIFKICDVLSLKLWDYYALMFRHNTQISDKGYREAFMHGVTNRDKLLNDFGFEEEDIKNYCEKLHILLQHVGEEDQF